MRKVSVLAVLALTGLSACTGEVRMQVVSLEVGGLIGATRSGGVEDVFSETGPTGTAELRLVGNGVDVSVRAGESVEVPVGEYRVTGGYEPDSEVCGIVTVSGEPRYRVDAALSVRKDQVSYVVPGEFSCWALVQDLTEVADYKNEGRYLAMAGHGPRWRVCYVWPDLDWTLTVVPADEDVYGDTEVDIVEGRMREGRWYQFSAGRLWQSGGIGVELPGWEMGE